MAKEINPFIVTGKIEPEYFCDRVKESERLVKSLTNGNNLVIISPRRMGKTGLIRFCNEKPEIKEEYNALEPEFAIIQALIDARKQRGITQKELSERTGISQGDISKLENGNGNPSVRTLKRPASAMGMAAAGSSLWSLRAKRIRAASPWIRRRSTRKR